VVLFSRHPLSHVCYFDPEWLKYLNNDAGISDIRLLVYNIEDTKKKKKNIEDIIYV